ncbi:MAG: hypothetical protein JJT96_13175 [Opitutales bacterium]|nr:hypothetical protein [Opitutales bacterium]
MNKTLLLLICDFLLISILALVEFKPLDAPERVVDEVAESGMERDLVEVLRLSLEDEAENRRRLAEEAAARARALEATERTLAETDRTLEERTRELSLTRDEREALAAERERLAAERESLASEVQLTQADLARQEAERRALDETLREERDRARQVQEELRRRQEELAARENALRELEAARTALERERERIATDLRISQTERALLSENLVAAQAEVERSRVEAERARVQAERLTEGVVELADRSTAIQEEIRQSRPLSQNVIFRNFEQNRIPIRFDVTVPTLFGSRESSHSMETLLVDHDGQIYALFEASRSPFRPEDLGRLQAVRGQMTLGTRAFDILEVSFLRGDPRVLAVAVPREAVEGAGLMPFRLAEDPLRFPAAVVVSDERGFFGESRFRLQPGTQRYLNMDARLFNRLFGEFSPRRGDVVFAQSGELLGFMITDNVSVVLPDMRSMENLAIGQRFDAREARRVQERLQRLLQSN